jgi:hypothetical protein
MLVPPVLSAPPFGSKDKTVLEYVITLPGIKVRAPKTNAETELAVNGGLPMVKPGNNFRNPRYLWAEHDSRDYRRNRIPEPSY